MDEGGLGLVSLWNLMYALAAALFAAGAWLMMQITGRLISYAPIVGGYMKHLVRDWAADVLQWIMPTLAAPFHWIQSEFDGHANSLGAYINTNNFAHSTHALKTTILHNDVKSVQSQIANFPNSQTVSHDLYALSASIATLQGKIAHADKTITDNLAWVKGEFSRAIDQRIYRAQYDAEHHAYLAAVSLLDAKDEIYRRKVAEITDGVGLPAGILHDTIPVALALAVTAEATLLQEAESCYNPMCSDWQAAKGLLEGLLAGFGAAGALEFLAQAVQHPESLGKTVAGYADEIGNLAVSTFYDTLGLAGDRPPPPTS